MTQKGHTSSTPRFTIVTPSYNQARYIGETICSVLTQQGDFEIEYFVMDGGSTDESVDIIRSFAGQVASGNWDCQCSGLTMEWASQPDRGQSEAINRGLRLATGEIIGYINSDDRYLPGAFHEVAAAFATNPHADFVFGDGDVIGAQGEVHWEWFSRPYNHRVMTSYHFLWNAFTNYIMQPATFWRRRVHDQIGYLDETFHFAMDAEYWIRAADQGLRLVHVPRKLATFRMIEGTKSQSGPTVFWEDYLEIFRRYRGSASLGRFFAYYYYNLALHRDFDFDRAFTDGRSVFARWAGLPVEERRLLEAKARRGFALAHVLAARDLLHAGRLPEADRAIGQALRQGSGPTTIVLSAGYLLLRLAGPGVRRWIEQLRVALVQYYRRRFRHVDSLPRPQPAGARGMTSRPRF